MFIFNYGFCDSTDFSCQTVYSSVAVWHLPLCTTYKYNADNNEQWLFYHFASFFVLSSQVLYRRPYCSNEAQNLVAYYPPNIQWIPTNAFSHSSAKLLPKIGCKFTFFFQYKLTITKNIFSKPLQTNCLQVYKQHITYYLSIFLFQNKSIVAEFL